MARKALVDSILKLYSKLGGNVGEVLGTRTNISFLGTGKSPEGFIDSTININAIGTLGKNKVLNELKSSMGYLTANKLNDVQAGKLYENMLKIDEVFNPKQIPNITDMATGTRDLTQEGLGSLRQKPFLDEASNIANRDSEAMIKAGLDPSNPNDTIKAMESGIISSGDDVARQLDDIDPNSEIAASLRLEEKGKKLADSMSDAEIDLRSQFPRASDATINAMLVKPKGSNEITALETMTKNKAGTEFITGFVDDVYKNAGVTASVDVAKKRGAAREFLFTMLKKETDLLPQGGTLESVISPTDYKYIMEGGGGALGDPLILVKKYFGDTIVKRLPLNSDKEVIETFVENVRFTKDKAGFPNDDPRFNPDDLPEFKHGGLAKILEV